MLAPLLMLRAQLAYNALRDGMLTQPAALQLETARPAALVSTSPSQGQMDALTVPPASTGLEQRPKRTLPALPAQPEHTQLTAATQRLRCACHAMLEK